MSRVARRCTPVARVSASRSSPSGPGEELLDATLAIAEDARELGPDQRIRHLSERRQRKLPQDDVVHLRARLAVRSSDLEEGVRVMPTAVRTLDLLVDKAVGRLPRRDLGAPPKPDTEQAKPIVDQSALVDVDGPWRHDLEVELGRCDALEILSVGEKRKHLVARERQPGRGVESVSDRHRSGRGGGETQRPAGGSEPDRP